MKKDKILKFILVLAPIVGLILAILFNPTKTSSVTGWFSATVIAIGLVIGDEP